MERRRRCQTGHTREQRADMLIITLVRLQSFCTQTDFRATGMVNICSKKCNISSIAVLYLRQRLRFAFFLCFGL